jgi:NADPH:quinone reductase-like Zn-dependent oxidoreductase
MRAVWVTRHGGPEVLEVREAPDPSPRAGEVRIRVRAAGVNFADVMARQGLYPSAPKPPTVVGYEVAGVVDALGEGVTAPAEGARVLAMTKFGGYADTVCVPASQAFGMPDAMSFEEAAAMPVTYLTAHHALFRAAGLRAGERVLVHMAAGGVGIAALQLCRTVEGVTTFGTASAAKHDVIRAEGCDHPIDYRSVDWAEAVKELSGTRRLDVVLDPLGGRETMRGYKLLGPGGRLVTYGFAGAVAGGKRRRVRVALAWARRPRFDPLRMMSSSKTVAGVFLPSLARVPGLLEGQVDRLLELYAAGSLRPRIDSSYPLEKAGDAHRRLEDRGNVGKVLLTTGG